MEDTPQPAADLPAAPATDETSPHDAIALAALEAAFNVAGHVQRKAYKEAVLAMLAWADTLPPSSSIVEAEPAWRSKCGVCNATWKVTHAEDGRELKGVAEDNPGPHGTFCPDCRDKRLIAPGVLRWFWG